MKLAVRKNIHPTYMSDATIVSLITALENLPDGEWMTISQTLRCNHVLFISAKSEDQMVEDDSVVQRAERTNAYVLARRNKSPVFIAMRYSVRLVGIYRNDESVRHHSLEDLLYGTSMVKMKQVIPAFIWYGL